MKKKLPLVVFILFLLSAAWSAAAIVLLRGVGAYRLGTGIGTALAMSRPFTLAAAVLLAFVLVIWLIKKKTAKAAIAPAAACESVEIPTDTKPKKEKKAKKKDKKENKQEENKIPPAPAAPKIQPKAPEAVSETVLMSNLDTEDLREPAETVLVSPAAPVQEMSDEGATELMPSIPADSEGATELMPAPAAALPCCPRCGTPVVKEGQRFCAKCGAELKGGGV